ncbi:hypothetical protein [Microbacterium sp. MRS-1]|uniref:hypothetical protein n=1 Tax=Microbacterium sp. MRS-1 TaxID=1451261 RepID=UPI000450DA58|nr:hypothetical protein [Microbacterium sp. MRS-1]EXJ50741.1 hypothetical protein AS96_12935 [Microbacterium sp. MRS-1]
MHTLLVIDDGAFFADTQRDYSPLDRWERAVVDEAGGWDGSAPVYRRALASWRARLMEVLALLRPDVIAVTQQPSFAPRRAAARVMSALPHRRVVTAMLPVADGGVGALAYAVGQLAGEPFARVVIVSGQRGTGDLDTLRSEVAWRCGVTPLIVNAGRLGLLARDVENLAASVNPTLPQKRAQDALCALLAAETALDAQSAG